VERDDGVHADRRGYGDCFTRAAAAYAGDDGGVRQKAEGRRRESRIASRES
jgi:hypothetical protein